MNALLLWFILMLVFYMVLSLGARRLAAQEATAHLGEVPELPWETLSSLEALLAPMLTVTGRKVLGNAVEFDGRLRGETGAVFERIGAAVATRGLAPMLLEGEGQSVRLLLAPEDGIKRETQKPPNGMLHWLLFAATLVTTTWAGALHVGVNLLEQPERFAIGLPYSLTLLLILGSHELGHYFAAKTHGIAVTPPFFIPVPFALGTFGAFIRIKSLTPDRRALFDVAVAGPLAGLVFAVPALVIGLRFSQVIPGNSPGGLGHMGASVGSSVLLAFLAKLSLGASVMEGERLLMHPLAFAGWLGLIVTALNLLPIGQLDGGHISHALFGSRNARSISMVALTALFLLALFVWPGLMFWAFIVFFIAGTRDAPAANDVSPVGAARRALGYMTFLLLLLIITPVPRALGEVIGLHSPYL